MVDVIEDVQFTVVRGNLKFKCYRIFKYSVNEITAQVEAERRKGKRKEKGKGKACDRVELLKTRRGAGEAGGRRQAAE